jgi:hypothetical protein
MTIHNGKKIMQRGGAGAGRGDDAHGVTESQLNAGMQAREDSYGEPGEYEAEAAYAAQYQDSLIPKYEMNPEEQATAWEDEQYRKMEKDPSYEPPKVTY